MMDSCLGRLRVGGIWEWMVGTWWCGRRRGRYAWTISWMVHQRHDNSSTHKKQDREQKWRLSITEACSAASTYSTLHLC